MKHPHFLLLFFTLFCCSFSVLAQSPPQTGNACYYPPFGQIYQTLYATNTNDYIYNSGNGPYSFLACSRKTALQALGTCRVRIPNGQPQGGSYYNGQLFTINQIIACPLDVYTCFLLLATGAVGVLYLRKSSPF